MINIVPKWNKLNNKQKIEESFKKIVDRNNEMTDSNVDIYWKTTNAKKVAKTETSAGKRRQNRTNSGDIGNQLSEWLKWLNRWKYARTNKKVKPMA